MLLKQLRGVKALWNGNSPVPLNCSNTNGYVSSYLALQTFATVFFLLQVMQFGRIDGNAYILDFQYPFSAVQAFAVALANVTQRLK